MRPYMLIAPLVAAVLIGPSAAFAQQVIETYPSGPYDDEYVQSAPPAYSYRSDAPAFAPVRPASCGEFRYWNGDRCVDARVVPPPVR